MKPYSRKGQFATEFMMTYGWVMISIAGIFAALYAFGFLDISNILPEKCALTPGFGCRDFLLHPTSIVMEVTNGIGKKIEIDQMQATHASLGTCMGQPSGNREIENGATEQLTFDFAAPGCPFTLSVGSKEKLSLNFTYTIGDDVSTFYSARGTLFARVS
ncbi:hypothetical protein HY488_02760 [Candidatus Woesearchaeota archaeon]|nr:hypothetical protein [Candidatus Woesearchaeota archaeon]